MRTHTEGGTYRDPSRAKVHRDPSRAKVHREREKSCVKLARSSIRAPDVHFVKIIVNTFFTDSYSLSPLSSLHIIHIYPHSSTEYPAYKRIKRQLYAPARLCIVGLSIYLLVYACVCVYIYRYTHTAITGSVIRANSRCTRARAYKCQPVYSVCESACHSTRARSSSLISIGRAREKPTRSWLLLCLALAGSLWQRQESRERERVKSVVLVYG